MSGEEPRRVVAECPWRADVRDAGTPDEVATCRLLGEITGIDDESLFVAERRNCESCVRKFAPTKDRINALTATLLYHLSARILKRGGIEGYSVEKARELQAFAMSHLPVVGSSGWGQTAQGLGSKAPCFYLGEQTGERECRTCRGSVRQKVFTCRHERHVDTTMLDCQGCLDYEAPLDRSKVRTWAVGVTTAPRRKETLEQSLQSLANAGWPDAHVFAEPHSPLPDWLGPDQRTVRTKRLGAWPNWFLTLTEVMMRSPQADAYLICQDDVLYAKGLRSYLEETLWPASQLGVVSLHTASHQDRGDDLGYYPTAHGWSAWGAQAYVFPNAAARALLRHPRVVNHRRIGPHSGTRNVDCVVGQWALEAGLPYYLHSPSLTQHIGEKSTLWETASAEGRRRAITFIGEGPDIGDYMREGATALPSAHVPNAPNVSGHGKAAGQNGGSAPSGPSASLAIATVLIGRQDCFDRWKDWVLHAEIPENTSLYLVDNSGDLPFGNTLAAAIAEFITSRRFRGVFLRMGPGPIRSRARASFERYQNIADAFNLVLPEVREDYVLTIDDDTIPPFHAAPRLLEEFQQRLLSGEKLGIVSGIYESALAPGRLVVARSKQAWRDVPAVDALTDNDIIEVGFVGNGCCLLSREALGEILPMRAAGEPGGQGSGPDKTMCQTLGERGYTILAHGGVFCDHLF